MNTILVNIIKEALIKTADLERIVGEIMIAGNLYLEFSEKNNNALRSLIAYIKNDERNKVKITKNKIEKINKLKQIKIDTDNIDETILMILLICYNFI